MYPDTSPTIGVFGHYGNENMGDEAIVAAVIEEIKKRYPTARIWGFSIVPEDTENRHGIICYPIRRRPARRGDSSHNVHSPDNSDSAPIEPAPSARDFIKGIPVIYPIGKAIVGLLRLLRTIGAEIGFLLSSYRILRQVDLLIVAGSGQLLDEAGVWGFPYTLYKWSLLCRLSGCRLAFLGVGAGPLYRSLSRWFVKKALRRAFFRAYRDESSFALVNTLGDFKSDLICPDLAFGKSTPPFKPVPAKDLAITVGINPMAYHDPRYWPSASREIFDNYISGLTQIITRIAELGDRVVLFPTQLRADTLVINELLPTLDRVCTADVRRRITSVPVTGVESQLNTMAECDVIIATRFHGVVLGYLVGKPTIGIAYHDKIRDLTAYMGHPECSLPINPLDVEAVMKMYTKLRDDLGRSQSIVLEHLEAKRRELALAYDRMFALAFPRD